MAIGFSPTELTTLNATGSSCLLTGLLPEEEQRWLRTNFTGLVSPTGRLHAAQFAAPESVAGRQAMRTVVTTPPPARQHNFCFLFFVFCFRISNLRYGGIAL